MGLYGGRGKVQLAAGCGLKALGDYWFRRAASTVTFVRPDADNGVLG